MRFFILMIFITTIFNTAFGQEYIFETGKFSGKGNVYMNHSEGDDELHFLKIQSLNQKYKYLIHYTTINTVNGKRKESHVEEPIVTDGNFLNVFYQKKYFYVLNTNQSTDFIQIRRFSTATNKFEKPVGLSFIGKEKIVASNMKDDKIFIFTITKKGRVFKIYTLDITTNKLDKIEIEMEKEDFSLLLDEAKDNIPVSILDYDYILSATGMVDDTKIYFEGDKLIFYIRHTMYRKINLYEIDLNTKQFELINYKFSQSDWIAFGGTYYNGKLYTIGTDKYDLVMEVFDIDSEKNIYYHNSEDNKVFPFDYQNSSATMSRYPIMKDRRLILKEISRSIPLIYPEIVNDEVKLYAGCIENPIKSNNGLVVLNMLLGMTGYALSGESFLVFWPGAAFQTNTKEMDLGFTFFETKFTKDGILQEGLSFQDKIEPIFVKLKKRCQAIVEEKGVSYVATYRNQGNYYATFYSKKRKEILVKRLVID